MVRWGIALWVWVQLSIGVGSESVIDLPQGAAQGLCTVQAVGDGKSCRQVQLIVKNCSASSCTFRIQRYTVLDHGALQDVLLLEEKQFSVPAGGSARATSSAMCCGGRLQAPPGPRAESYSPVACATHPGGQRASKLYQTAVSLVKARSLGDLPILPSQQPQVIAQLAFWKERGDLEKAQFEQSTQKRLKLSPESPPQQQKEAHQGMDGVWSAVERTLKETL